MKEPLQLTVSAFSAMVGADRHELASRMAGMKCKPTGRKNGGELYALRDLVKCYCGGDIEAERIRKLRAESERVELQNARQRGELIEIATVKKLGEKVMIAVRNRILNMPLTDDEKDTCLRELLALGDMDWSR